MNKNYLEITWPNYLPQDESEILISFLFDIGFEAFQEEEHAFKAYIDSAVFNEIMFVETLSQVPVNSDLSNYQISLMPEKNWNEDWESHFTPVSIAGTITVRAPFHNISVQTPYEIIIQPKMSFGTGHHETTSGMLEMMLQVDFRNKKVIDMGSGTGILAVFAEKLGALSVTAIDNDPVCIDNSKEIFLLNNSKNIDVLLGDANSLKNMNTDVILANINRNILLSDIRMYSEILKKGGLLMMSGFYKHDLDLINEECRLNELKYIRHNVNNNWIICLYEKI